MISSTVFAMGSPQAGAAPAGGMEIMMQFFPLILMFAIFWFLLIRPQQKRAKAHKEMLAELKRGDYVITGSGIIGRIIEIDDEQILLESGDSKLRVSRAAVGALMAGKSGKESKGDDKKGKSDTAS